MPKLCIAFMAEVIEEEVQAPTRDSDIKRNSSADEAEVWQAWCVWTQKERHKYSRERNAGKCEATTV